MTNRDHIIPLDTRSVPDIRQIGGKGLGLLRLRHLGLAVPRGFCITSLAYHDHLDRLSVLQRIADRLNRNIETGSAFLSALRRTIIENPMDDSLSEAIRHSYDKLGAKCVAVRSSATVEDLEAHSFAGQYESYLGIDNFPKLCEAVKKCWASMWTERAFHYRKNNNLGHLEHGMAVVVQEMIAGESSGVVFTVDPKTGSKSNIIIESCWGLGEALVSGKVDPDRTFIDRRRFKVRKSIIGTKNIKILENGKAVSLAREESEKLSIDAGLARKLARRANRIEKAFATPVDIEWTIKDGKIYFLQARPITVQFKQKTIEDRQVWTDANTGEVLPDVVTPLTWSVAGPIIMAIFNSALSIIGTELKENSVCGLICGRAYFNINMIAGLLRNIPGFSKLDITAIFGGGDLTDITIPEEDIPVVRIRLSDTALALPIRLTKLMTVLYTSKLNFLAEFKEKIERFEGLQYKPRSDQNLITLWHEVMAFICGGLRESAYSGMAMLFYPNLDKLCQKWLASKPGVMVNQLLAGIGDIESARSGLALYELARIARNNPQLRKAVSRAGKWNDIRRDIEKITGGPDFLASWDDYMAAHGHHTRCEAELSYPRWSESPDYILDMIRNYLSVDTKDDALEQYRTITDRRIRLTKYCNDRLKNPFKRMIFNFYLTRAQRGSIIRENLKNVLVKALRIIRQIVLEIGGRLKERGIITSVDDIFFLNTEEIQAALASVNAPAIKKIVAQRRSEYKWNLKIRPPHVIKGSFNPDDYIPHAVDKHVRILKGLSISPGLVTGKARVVLNTSSKERVLPGEILVAPFTDPGWALYFMTAAAIVVDMGGLLSHGSIVAREYGIPAVVNVGPATSIIKTGQLLQVDGDVGVVKIL